MIFLIALLDTIEIKLKEEFKKGNNFALKELAKYYLKKENYKKALKTLKKYIKLNFDDDSAYDLIVRIYGTLKDFKNAYYWSKQAYLKFPDNINFLKYQAIFLDHMDKIDQAIIIYKKLYEMDSTNIENLVNYATALYRKGDYDKAIIFLKLADSILNEIESKSSFDVYLKYQNEHYRVLAALSIIYNKKQDYSKAVIYGIRAYIYSSREKRDFYDYLVKLLYDSKEYEKLIEICQDLIKTYTNESLFYTYLGFGYFNLAQQKNIDSLYIKALEAFSVANNISFSPVNVYYIARSYKELGLKNEAYKEIDKVLDYGDEYKILKIYMLLEDRRIEEAKEFALTIKSKEPSLFAILAYGFEYENKLKLAEKYLKLALKYDKNNLKRYRDLSNFYKRHNQVSKAREVLLEYIKLEPQDYLAYFEIAEEYNRSAMFDKAIYYYESAIKILEKIIDTTSNKEILKFASILYNNYGYMLVNENIDIEKGFNLLKKAIELNPTDPHILDSFGWALFKKGYFEEAFKYIKRAYSEKPDDSEIRNHYEIIKKILNID
ncbi:MAG: hypothetical protein ABIL49_06935 [candidate division WOR-3 bacterium]